MAEAEASRAWVPLQDEIQNAGADGEHGLCYATTEPRIPVMEVAFDGQIEFVLGAIDVHDLHESGSCMCCGDATIEFRRGTVLNGVRCPDNGGFETQRPALALS